MIDNVDEKHTVGTGMEQVIIVRVDRQTLLNKLIILASAVESTSDDRDLFTKVLVMAA